MHSCCVDEFRVELSRSVYQHILDVLQIVRRISTEFGFRMVINELLTWHAKKSMHAFRHGGNRSRLSLQIEGQAI